MDVSNLFIRDYEQMDTWSIGKNEPKRTQNEPKLKKAKMNVNSIITKDYENMSNWAIYENEPKTKPIQTQTKPMYRSSAPGEAGTNTISNQVYSL